MTTDDALDCTSTMLAISRAFGNRELKRASVMTSDCLPPHSDDV